MSKKTLEERFDDRIKDEGFGIFEISGFKSEPHLALKAGMAMGYQMACDDIASQQDASPDCAHEWVSAKNQVVKSGEICLKCNSIRSG